MTGKELIVYILSNNLENVKLGPDTLEILGYITKDAFAVKNRAGLSTVDAWILMGRIPFVTIGNKVYVPNKTLEELQKERLCAK